ncbi:MAG: ATP-binding protein, partial [Selenomonas sp.]|nr:ATP-binding protein [Selenomonas sp.]
MKFKESSTLELKQIIVPDIKKEIIAFANSNGGTIYVGIADNGDIIGLEDTDQAMLQITSMVRDAIKPDVTMFVDLDIIELEQKSVLKITVQKGTHAPYYLQGKGIRPEGVFVRHGAASIPASTDAIRSMIIASDGESYETRRSLRQELTFTSMKKLFAQKKVKLENQQFMTLGLKTRDGIFTNLALLLSEECPHELKIAVFAGTSKTSPFQNQREFSGSLLTQINEAYAMLEQYNQFGQASTASCAPVIKTLGWSQNLKPATTPSASPCPIGISKPTKPLPSPQQITIPCSLPCPAKKPSP